MTTASDIKRFKQIKSLFENLKPEDRSRLLSMYSDLNARETFQMITREQVKLLFMIFYGKHGEDIIERIKDLSREQ